VESKTRLQRGLKQSKNPKYITPSKSKGGIKDPTSKGIETPREGQGVEAANGGIKDPTSKGIETPVQALQQLHQIRGGIKDPTSKGIETYIGLQAWEPEALQWNQRPDFKGD